MVEKRHGGLTDVSVGATANYELNCKAAIREHHRPAFPHPPQGTGEAHAFMVHHVGNDCRPRPIDTLSAVHKHPTSSCSASINELHRSVKVLPNVVTLLVLCGAVTVRAFSPPLGLQRWGVVVKVICHVQYMADPKPLQCGGIFRLGFPSEEQEPVHNLGRWWDPRMGRQCSSSSPFTSLTSACSSPLSPAACILSSSTSLDLLDTALAFDLMAR